MDIDMALVVKNTTPEGIGMVRAEPFETFIAGDGKPARPATTADLWRFPDG